MSDVLSEILGGVRMNAAIYFDGEFAAPWGVSIPDVCMYGQTLSPGSDHIIGYHLVLEGGCTVQVGEGPPVTLSPGDLMLLPHGAAHKLWNGTPAIWEQGPQLANYSVGSISSFRAGPQTAGERTRLVCGYLGCDRHAGALFLAGLPPVVIVNVRLGDDWIESSIRRLVDEAALGRAGAGALLSRMAEALFVESLRRWIDELPDDQTSWLAGTRDPLIGRALALLHGDPSRAWTLDDLAREAGASRSVLGERFARMVGEAPLTYLASIRLQQAARMLESTRKTVVQVASDVGYESEAAFNRAFKRQFGEPPARFRRRAQSARDGSVPVSERPAAPAPPP